MRVFYNRDNVIVAEETLYSQLLRIYNIKKNQVTYWFEETLLKEIERYKYQQVPDLNVEL